jgi:hypothetical protein
MNMTVGSIWIVWNGLEARQDYWDVKRAYYYASNLEELAESTHTLVVL